MNELLGMTDSTGTDIRYNDVVPVTHPEPLTPDEGGCGISGDCFSYSI